FFFWVKRASGKITGLLEDGTFCLYLFQSDIFVARITWNSIGCLQKLEE
ncbi:6899_t:CDS:2, partial [Gigaspora rosea]